MNIRPVPITDFVLYLEEQIYEGKPHRLNCILDAFDEYFQTLNECDSITPIGGDYITDWCQNNSGDIASSALVAGMIVYKKDALGHYTYGITYQPWYLFQKGETSPGEVSVVILSENNYPKLVKFLPDAWDGWAAPCRYFFYPASSTYIDNNTRSLGDRPICIGAKGHDVEQLIALMRRAYPDLPQSGIFDKMASRYLFDLQRICQVSTNGIFDALTEDGRKILRYLDSVYFTKAL